MFLSGFLLSQNSDDSITPSGSGNNNSIPAKDIKKFFKDLLVAIIVMVIIDLVLLIWGIHCAVSCGQAKGWNSFLVFLLILFMFIPGFGGIVAISIIVYRYAAGCNKPKLSFTFY